MAAEQHRIYKMDVLSAYGEQLVVEFHPWYRTYEGEHVGRITVSDLHGMPVHSTRTFEQATDGWKMGKLEWLGGGFEWRNGEQIIPNRISSLVVDGIVLWLSGIMKWELKNTTD